MPIAFKKILCPIDLNAVSLDALELALTTAQRHQGSIRLLYVSSLPMPRDADAVTAESSELRERLERLGRESLGGKVPYEVDIWTGDAATAILRAIDESDADLAVMATHGRSGMDHLVLGSVTERVVRESPIPILTIKPAAKVNRLM
jgi:universal stress protein A